MRTGSSIRTALPDFADVDFETIRSYFKPSRVDTLLIGESSVSGTFFYNGDSNLFRQTHKAFMQVYGPACGEGESFLRFFQEHGFYLDDLCCETPLGELTDFSVRESFRQRAVPELARRLQQEKPRTIITIMRRIVPHVQSAVAMAGITTDLYALPFPSQGRQEAYVAGLSQLLGRFRGPAPRAIA